MFGFTKKTDYALVALLGLANQADEADQLSARQIAERYDLPLPALMGILKVLVGEGVMKSTRGPRGGYSLARRPGEISVNDVITAIEGPVTITDCCESKSHRRARSGDMDDDACRLQKICPVSTPVRRLNQQIRNYLCSVTLADLMLGGSSPLSPADKTAMEFETTSSLSEEGS
jgi:Rrf2 family protein